MKKLLFLLSLVMFMSSCSVYPSLSSNFNVPLSDKVDSRINVNASNRYLSTDFNISIRGKRSTSNIRIPVTFNK
jgi:hypothetical protein